MDTISMAKEIKGSSAQFDNIMSLNEKYKGLYERNEKLEQEIERQKASLLKHSELIEKHMIDKQNIQDKIEQFEYSQHKSAKKSTKKLDDDSLNVEQLKHQIEVLNEMIKNDEDNFVKK